MHLLLNNSKVGNEYVLENVMKIDLFYFGIYCILNIIYDPFF